MAKSQRFEFIDQFRGLVGVMMALGHSNYYFNAVWWSLDPVDPFFDNLGQFLLRYMGYLCAPGFLVMNGAMTYWLYVRGLKAGLSPTRTYWRIIQRGLFLIGVQIIWVNASWSGFARLRLDHFGIIATIGSSMILLTLILRWAWWARLLVAAVIVVAHPFLLRIHYDHDSWIHYPMQLFVDCGDYNKYPILPWLALAIVGSVMAHFWFERWQGKERAVNTLVIGVVLILAAMGLRMVGGWTNIFPHAGFFTWSFFLVQKYPPSLVHEVWFAGAVIFMVGIFCAIGLKSHILRPLAVVGKVPMFFYAAHIPLLAIFTRHLGIYYREGGVVASLVGWVGLLLVMYPLAIWFAGVKRRHRNWFIRMV